MLRILFVDDDKQLLSGLRRLLKVDRGDWQCHFCLSGQEGLDLLQTTDVDVVVSDIRMPGMDGVEFLTLVQKLHPNSVRIVLSGHMGEHEAAWTIKSAHQFIAKPCTVENMLTIIERTYRFRDFFTDNDLRSLVNEIDSLPLLPAVYLELTRAMDDESKSLEDIAGIIGRDPAMSASILKAVNSAFFGLKQQVGSVRQAVTLLGMDTIRGLVLCEGIFRQFTSMDEDDFSLKLLWDHSLRVSGLVRQVVRMEGLGPREEDVATLVGLLHDLGKLVLADCLPGKYKKVMALVQEKSISTRQAEIMVLGTDHARLGAYLLGLWGFSEEIVYSVAYHHQPRRCSYKTGSMLDILYVVNLFDHSLVRLNVETFERQVDMEYMQEQGLDKRMEDWLKLCRKELGGEQQ
ncbi:MAG: HDOD domain-containing protein [Proteobacteria bacterium]|nr:HDOD domain-containing protein [Pseudomonadota bacterium]MBU1611198.1 HDOD domain-containing protein [Pseudomonadota bacterium]